MKTIKLYEDTLNEAPTTARTDTRNRAGLEFWKAEWSNPEINKLDAARAILNEVIPQNQSVVDKILSFGEWFVTAWINAMKLDEIYYKGNELIILLKSYTKDNSEYLKNYENFNKLYNVYAKNYLDKSFFKNQTYRMLLNSPDAYNLEARDFEWLFSSYIELIEDKHLDDDAIKGKYFEKSGRLRPLAEIRANLQGSNINARNAGIKLGKEAAEQAKQFTNAYLDQMKTVFKDDSMFNDFKSEVGAVLNLT